MDPLDLKEGDKVRVFAGDRDTVCFDPFGTIRNIQPDGRCEIQLNSCFFYHNIKNIGPKQTEIYYKGYDVALFDWDEHTSTIH